MGRGLQPLPRAQAHGPNAELRPGEPPALRHQREQMAALREVPQGRGLACL